MAGTILENLSGLKLSILVGAFLICQVICFLIAGLIAPKLIIAQTTLGTVCKDVPEQLNDTSIWFYSRGDGKCEGIHPKGLEKDYTQLANEIVFVFQLPVPREGKLTEFSRWQQKFKGILQADIAYDENFEMDSNAVITIDARLAYRNKGDKDDDWKYYASSVEQRKLSCAGDSCLPIPLFELASLHHDFYLLNVRLPIDPERKWNLNIGNIRDLYLTQMVRNDRFTKVLISFKTVFFPFIIGIMCWFWNRVRQLQRSPVLIEYMLMFLGGALAFLNLPIEYFILFFDMPYMRLISDIRKVTFYGSLLSFWLIFAGERMLIEDGASTLKTYWKHLSAVFLGIISLSAVGLYEHGAQIWNPFYSIEINANVAVTFMILAGILAFVYFIFLCYLILCAFRNISKKHTSMQSMTIARHLNYDGIVYRFKILMVLTLLTSAVIVFGFAVGQVSDNRYRLDHAFNADSSAVFYNGIYGMWNIYIFALIAFYAPSHKQWPVADEENASNFNIDRSGVNVKKQIINKLIKKINR